MPTNLELASYPNTSPETLALLAKDEDWSIRYYVAKNPNTSPEVLALLANDEDSYVSRMALDNPNLPDEYKMLYLLEK